MAKRSTQTIQNIENLTDAQVLALVGAIPAARVKRAKEALAARTGAGPTRTFTAQAVTLTVEGAEVEVEGQTERAPTVNVLSMATVGTLLHFSGVTREAAVAAMLAVCPNLPRGAEGVIAARLAASKPEGAKYAKAFKAALAEQPKVPKNGRTFTHVTGKVELE